MNAPGPPGFGRAGAAEALVAEVPPSDRNGRAGEIRRAQGRAAEARRHFEEALEIRGLPRDATCPIAERPRAP